jgi:hypothetical protein
MVLVHRVGWDAQLCERNSWFWPLRAAASQFAEHSDWPTLQELGDVYRTCTRGLGAAELTFSDNVRKSDKRVRGRVVLSALYDARITLQHEVPTRERNWHDLLNMLCFTTFPHSKLALHARQYARLAERIDEQTLKLPNRRTPEQDALTLFDEGGVVLAVEAEAAAQLREVPVQEREVLSQELSAQRRLRVVPFGHALYEHWVEGLRCPGGCTQIIEVDALWTDTTVFLQTLDRALAAHLRSPAQLQSPVTCGQIKLAAFAL